LGRLVDQRQLHPFPLFFFFFRKDLEGVGPNRNVFSFPLFRCPRDISLVSDSSFFSSSFLRQLLRYALDFPLFPNQSFSLRETGCKMAFSSFPLSPTASHCFLFPVFFCFDDTGRLHSPLFLFTPARCTPVSPTFPSLSPSFFPYRSWPPPCPSFLSSEAGGKSVAALLLFPPFFAVFECTPRFFPTRIGSRNTLVSPFLTLFFIT